MPVSFEHVRSSLLALPDVVEAPHFQYTSFRVGGKIFVTVPPAHTHLHVFITDEQREAALAMEPESVGKLLWGGKVVGVRVDLSAAAPELVTRLLRQAWERKAPKRLRD